MSKALEGIRVLLHGRFWAGPVIGTQLGDFGAEVIRFEDPEVMDFIRDSPPFIKKGDKKIGLYYAYKDRNSKSMSLNLRKEGGKKAFKDLAKISDIIIDNHAPGVMDNWGLGYETMKEINPRLIWVAVSTYGQSGPYSAEPGYDILAQGASGLMDINGFPDGPPLRMPVGMADTLGGLCGVKGTLIALFHRERTGQGQMVDVSLFESATYPLQYAILQWTGLQEKYTRMGNKWGWGAYGPFKAKDGWLIIATALDRQWYKLCEVMGRPELAQDPKFATVEGRSYYKHGEEADNIIREWLKTRTVKETVALLKKNRIPSAPVNDIPALVEDPQYNSRKNMFEVDYPGIGKLKIPGPVPHLSATPGALETPAPQLGEHNDYIYRELLGYNDEKIGELEREGVIVSKQEYL